MFFNHCLFRAAPLFLLLHAVWAQLPPQNPASDRIGGVVRRAGTGDPIEGAAVWMEMEAENPRDALIRRYTRTDRDGRFVFTEVTGKAYLFVARTGYVDRQVCRRRGEDCGVKAGNKDSDNLIVDLTPTGAVSGVIAESGRDPLPLIGAQLLRLTYDEDGRKTFSAVATTSTDDRGEYRFFNVAPGRYYIRAGTLSPPNNSLRPRYSRQYYPGVEDPERATAIDVQADSEAPGKNLWLSLQTTFRIRGHIVDSRAEKPPASVSIAVISNVPGERVNLADFDGGAAAYTATDGAFELRDVLPGDYTLVVTSRSSEQGAAKAAGYAAVRVTNSDVNDVAVTFAPAGVLSGRVVVEGQEGAATLPLDPPKILLRPILDGARMEIPNVPSMSLYAQSESNVPGFEGSIFNENGYTTKRIAYKLDGTFRIEGLLPGRYRLSLSAGYTLKEALFDGTDVLAHDLIFVGSASGPLAIVLASRVGSVVGQISYDAKAEQQGRATVVFVPNGMPDRSDRFTIVRSSADGHFEATKILPGHYRVFAWTDVEPNAYLNREFRAQFEAYGTPLHVTAGVNPELSLKVAPNANP